MIQSDGNSFREDVVLDSFNMAYRDEDKISDKNYEIFWVINFISDLRKCIFEVIQHITTTHKIGFMLLQC